MKIMEQVNNEVNVSDYLGHELAATVAYKNLIEESNLGKNKWKILKLLKNHEEALKYWYSEASQKSKTANVELSIWPTLIKGLVKRGKTLGMNSVYKELKVAEEQELESYRLLVAGSQASPGQKSYVRSILVPAYEAQIRQLIGIIKKNIKGE
jgi:hypothetical protein